MPLGYTLTQAQKESIHGQFWSNDTTFNVVKNDLDEWYLPDFLTDTSEIANTQFAWLLALPIKFHTPPTVTL